MTDTLQDLRNAFWEPEGQWWFDANDPINEEAASDMSEKEERRKDEESKEPMPPSYGSHRPKCKTCGDPNFSLEKDQCIGCRIAPR